MAWGIYDTAIRRWEAIYGEAPSPRDEQGRLAPAFVTWMMGLPVGWVDGLKRTAALRCVGNAVQVQCAEEVGHWIVSEEAST